MIIRIVATFLKSSEQIVILIKKMLVFLIAHELFCFDCKKVRLMK